MSTDTTYYKGMIDKIADHTIDKKMNTDNLPHSKAMQEKKASKKRTLNILLQGSKKKK